MAPVVPCFYTPPPLIFICKLGGDRRLICSCFSLCFRLEMAIGCGGLPFSPSDSTNASGEMTAAAEAISSLRLHYEEIVVRLYSCQSNASSLLRDPSKSAADAWEAVRQGLAEARLSTGPLNCDDDQNLWRKAEDLVETMANKAGETGAALASGKSPSSEDNNPGACVTHAVDVNFLSWCILYLHRLTSELKNFVTDVPVRPVGIIAQIPLANWKRERGGFLWQPRKKKALAFSKGVAATTQARTTRVLRQTQASQTSMSGCHPRFAADAKDKKALLRDRHPRRLWVKTLANCLSAN